MTHQVVRSAQAQETSRPFREEAFSFFTHSASALVAIVGLVALVIHAHGPLAVTAVAIYGSALVAMFAASALHHVAHSEDGVFRKIDMTSIYLLIAGTYTPVCLLSLPSAWGRPTVAGVWVLALAGIALRWSLPARRRWLTAGLYVGLGWIAIFGIVPLARAVGWSGLALLFGGGIVYTLGAVIYAKERPDPWPKLVGHHGLWHVFVMVAAALHFALVWRITAP